MKTQTKAKSKMASLFFAYIEQKTRSRIHLKKLSTASPTIKPKVNLAGRENSGDHLLFLVNPNESISERVHPISSGFSRLSSLQPTFCLNPTFLLMGVFL